MKAKRAGLKSRRRANSMAQTIIATAVREKESACHLCHLIETPATTLSGGANDVAVMKPSRFRGLSKPLAKAMLIIHEARDVRTVPEPHLLLETAIKHLRNRAMAKSVAASEDLRGFNLPSRRTMLNRATMLAHAHAMTNHQERVIEMILRRVLSQDMSDLNRLLRIEPKLNKSGIRSAKSADRNGAKNAENLELSFLFSVLSVRLLCSGGHGQLKAQN